MQSQLTRPYGHDQAEEPIRIHHPEEEEHHEKGASKVLKKVKEKAKKIKNTLTKNGHGHEHDHHVDQEDDEPDPEAHGAPVYESSAVKGGVTGQPESLSHAGETNIPAPEEIIPPGTKAFPVVSSDYTKPVEPEPLQDTLYGHEALSHHARTADTSDKEERREAPIQHPLKVSDLTDESPDQETGPGLEKDFDRQSEFGIGKDSPKRFGAESGAAQEGDFSTTELKRDLPTGTHDQFSPEISSPKDRDNFEETRDEKTQETKPITYTEKLASATSLITEKVIAAKDAVASKLGYSGERGGGGGGQYESSVRDETPRSATGYGQKMAGTVAEKLTPVYEKVIETGSNVMTKLPLSGGGGVKETQQGEGKTVSARDYLSGKLRPGEEDKALSEVIAEKLHLGGGGGGEKKTTTTKEMEVTVEKIPTEKVLEEREHDEAVGEEGKGGVGMAGKIKGAVTSWLGGTKPKSPHSVEESSQSLGSTVGTAGFSDSGGSELTGKTGVGSAAVPVQRGLGN